MRALAAGALALCLAAPAFGGALDELQDLGPRQKISPSDEAMGSLARLPREDLLELRRLYERYDELVEKLSEDGWRSRLESGELIEHPDEAVWPARQIAEAADQRQKELDRLAARRAKARTQEDADGLDAAIAAKQAELKKLKRQLSREKGTCADWSDAVWAALTKVGAEDWDIRDGPRRARPWHTAAIACAPAGSDAPTVCLAFDPWRTGEPDVYDFYSWNDGSFDGRIAPEYFLHHLPEKDDGGGEDDDDGS